MDSVCSAWAYSILKNKLDDGNIYKPIMLGAANSNTKQFFASNSLDLPDFMHDAKPRVGEVKKSPTYSMTSSDPIYLLMDLYSRMRPTVVPVIDNGEYRCLLSSDDINNFFLRESRHGERMSYTLSEENIGRVIKGTFLKHGSGKDVKAPYMVGAMEYGVFLSRLDKCQTKPVLIIGDRRKHLEAAISRSLPGIVLTGIERLDEFDFDFSSFSGFVYVSAMDTAETLRLMRLSTPLSDIMQSEDTLYISGDGFNEFNILSRTIRLNLIRYLVAVTALKQIKDGTVTIEELVEICLKLCRLLPGEVYNYSPEFADPVIYKILCNTFIRHNYFKVLDDGTIQTNPPKIEKLVKTAAPLLGAREYRLLSSQDIGSLKYLNN